MKETKITKKNRIFAMFFVVIIIGIGITWVFIGVIQGEPEEIDYTVLTYEYAPDFCESIGMKFTQFTKSYKPCTNETYVCPIAMYNYGWNYSNNKECYIRT